MQGFLQMEAYLGYDWQYSLNIVYEPFKGFELEASSDKGICRWIEVSDAQGQSTVLEGRSFLPAWCGPSLHPFFSTFFNFCRYQMFFFWFSSFLTGWLLFSLCLHLLNHGDNLWRNTVQALYLQRSTQLIKVRCVLQDVCSTNRSEIILASRA